MPYFAAVVVLFLAWFWLFHQVGNLLLRHRSDWANLANTDNPAEMRRIGRILDVKHLAFVALMLGALILLLHGYPEHRGWTLGIGVAWALFIFPWGLLALAVILLLWVV